MKESTRREIEKIVSQTMGNSMAGSKARLEAQERQMRHMQYQIDVLYGADPAEVQTDERRVWKKAITERVSKIRECYPEEAVRYDYRIIFGKLYTSMKIEHGVDLNVEKEEYMKRHNIPASARSNVRALNVVYDNEELRELFEQTVEKFESYYVKEKEEVKEC